MHTRMSVGVVLLGCLLPVVQVMALSDEDVRAMQQECEAARSEALAPMRARKTQDCIDQQLRSPGHCERYYTTYGNVTPGPSGAPQQGYFYDLPQCQAWLKARDQLQAGRSRR